jgi:hypothetical protein
VKLKLPTCKSADVCVAHCIPSSHCMLPRLRGLVLDRHLQMLEIRLREFD